jgi:hypothetical protein
MTIIACRDGVIASDTGESAGGIVTSDSVTKLFRLSGSVVGCSGDAFVIQQFLDWSCDRSAAKPSFEKDEFDALELSPRGIYRWDHKLRIYLLPDAFSAIGANWEFATGAMAAGFSAKAAVALTIKYSIYCHGRVEVMRLDARDD